jgi:hypothetical protein
LSQYKKFAILSKEKGLIIFYFQNFTFLEDIYNLLSFFNQFWHVQGDFSLNRLFKRALGSFQMEFFIGYGLSYGISVLQMIMDMFHLSYTLPDPFLIHDLSPCLYLD